MEFSQILTAIENSEMEKKAEIVAAIKAEFESVKTSRHRANARASDLEGLIDEIVAATGADGVDIDAKAKAAKQKILELKRGVNEKTEAESSWEAQKRELEQQLESLKEQSQAVTRRALTSEIAAANKLNPKALTRLFEVGKITPNKKEDGSFEFLVDGQKDPLTYESLCNTDDWKLFTPSLQSVGSGSTENGGSEDRGKAAKRPTAGTNGGRAESPNLAKSYLKGRYSLKRGS